MSATKRKRETESKTSHDDLSGFSGAEVQYLQSALKLAREAGAVILEAARNPKSIVTKSNSTDVVTETDKRCEDIIVGQLKSLYPKHKFIAEESHVENGVYDFTVEPTWLVDPIDGTTNFTRAFPMSCVSIGLAINRKPVVGCVYNPYSDEMFYAISGQGAFLNGKRIKTSDKTAINGAVVVTEFGYERGEAGIDLMLGRLRKLLRANIQGLRSIGSCAINMCYVACGKLDGYYEGHDKFQGPKPWDFGASQVIVQEAGGNLIDFKDGSPFDMTQGRILCCATKALQAQMLDVLKE